MHWRPIIALKHGKKIRFLWYTPSKREGKKCSTSTVLVMEPIHLFPGHIANTKTIFSLGFVPCVWWVNYTSTASVFIFILCCVNNFAYCLSYCMHMVISININVYFCMVNKFSTVLGRHLSISNVPYEYGKQTVLLYISKYHVITIWSVSHGASAVLFFHNCRLSNLSRINSNLVYLNFANLSISCFSIFCLMDVSVLLYSTHMGFTASLDNKFVLC